jgi:hypothetical protein
MRTGAGKCRFNDNSRPREWRAGLPAGVLKAAVQRLNVLWAEEERELAVAVEIEAEEADKNG